MPKVLESLRGLHELGPGLVPCVLRRFCGPITQAGAWTFRRLPAFVSLDVGAEMTEVLPTAKVCSLLSSRS